MKVYDDPRVAILMGSDSDLPVMQAALEVLDEFDVGYEVRVMSAHRTPGDVQQFVSGAAESGIGVIIAGAGGAAHLPGVVAAWTTLPVIGVPICGKSLGGLDSLLSIVQMPRGVPVATVAVDGAANAALLAVQILALKYPHLGDRLAGFKREMADKVRRKDEIVREKTRRDKDGKDE